MTAFAKALKFTMKWEGGHVNDPADPGGETKYGISKKAYPDLDIAGLTKEDAAEIYLRDYWDKLDCDRYDEKLGIAIFDAGVNVGVNRVRTWLSLDFKVGALDHKEFNARREHYYRVEVKESLRSRYLKGWLNRLNDLKWYLTKM